MEIAENTEGRTKVTVTLTTGHTHEFTVDTASGDVDFAPEEGFVHVTDDKSIHAFNITQVASLVAIEDEAAV